MSIFVVALYSTRVLLEATTSTQLNSYFQTYTNSNPKTAKISYMCLTGRQDKRSAPSDALQT